MNQPYLVQTANALRQPTAAASAEFEASRDSLAEELSRRMSARPELQKLIGHDNLAMMQDNSRNFCRFMGTMFVAYEPEVLVQTVLWVFRAYRSHGFNTTYCPANIDTFVEILRDRVGASTFAQIYPFFEWLIVHIPTFVIISDRQLADPLALAPAPSHEIKK